MPNKILTVAQAWEIMRRPDFTMAQLKGYGFTLHFSFSEYFVHRSLLEIKSVTQTELRNIQTMAYKMELVRTWIRRLIPNAVLDVSSWWRSLSANLKAGGATRSSHMLGLAVDFTVRGMSGVEGCRRVQALLIKAVKDLDISLEITNDVWVHVDNRPAEIVFENLGKGRYRVWGPAERAKFAKKYGYPA